MIQAWQLEERSRIASRVSANYELINAFAAARRGKFSARGGRYCEGHRRVNQWKGIAVLNGYHQGLSEKCVWPTSLIVAADNGQYREHPIVEIEGVCASVILLEVGE